MTATLADLKHRIEVLEALASITRLCADYCHGADRRDMAMFQSVWAEDGVWEVSPDQAFVGVTEIGEAIAHQWDGTTRAFHWSSNPAVTIDADGLDADGRHDALTHVQLNDGTWLEIAGTYTDRYVKTESGWKIARRAARVHSQRSS